MAINAVVLLLGAGLDRLITATLLTGTAAAGTGGGGGGAMSLLCQAWQSLYHVVVLSFGENFPDLGELAGQCHQGLEQLKILKLNPKP